MKDEDRNDFPPDLYDYPVRGCLTLRQLRVGDDSCHSFAVNLDRRVDTPLGLSGAQPVECRSICQRR